MSKVPDEKLIKTNGILDLNKIPIVINADLIFPEGLKTEMFDGFSDVSAILNQNGRNDRDDILRFIEMSINEGGMVWLNDWSPLYWCHACAVPLLSERCDTCGSHGGDKIHLKFPSNPRPVLPHDERMFRSVGFPWPHDYSTVLNYYINKDHTGWEVIRQGRLIGDIIYNAREEYYHFEPGRHFNDKTFSDDAPVTVMDDVIRANESRLNRLERDAIAFIRGHLRNVFTVPIAAFSGGKDSQVLIHLCSLADKKMRLVQVDTGVDPASNRDFSDAFLSRYSNFRVKRISNDDIFWRALEKLGPPATDFQWCREILKKVAAFRERKNYLLGLVKILQRMFHVKVIFIEGTRRREEPWRVILKKDVEIKNAMIKSTDIRPIVDFTDLDIWMYLRFRDLPLHPTYTEEKNQRMICLFCPDKTGEEMNLVRHNSPAEWERFAGELERWRSIFGFPEQWTTRNLWMHDKPASRYMREIGIGSRIDLVRNRLSGVIEDGTGTRTKDGYAVSMKIKVPFKTSTFAGWLRPFGKVSHQAGDGTFRVRSRDIGITVSGDGMIHVVYSDKNRYDSLHEKFRQWAVSQLNCTGCGACVIHCPKITIKDTMAHIKKTCTQCGECIDDVVSSCPCNAMGIERCLVNKQDS